MYDYGLCLDKNDIALFQEEVVLWYKANGRSFSWRTQELNEWKWLVLEILLKKTRAETVDKHYEVFINKYDTPKKLHLACIEELESDLKKFGLYKQRIEALKLIAAAVVNDYECSVGDYLLNTDLKEMKHVGLYTYNAVQCFHFGKRVQLVDVNIARIITRFLDIGMPKDLRSNWIWCMAGMFLPLEDYIDYNYGLLDMGALICKKKPFCTACPLFARCTSAGKYR